MRVLYLIHTTSMCGSTISFINMIKGLHAKGVEIFIAHPDKKIDNTFYSSTRDITKAFFYVDLKSHTIDKNFRDSDLSKDLKQILKQSKIVQKILFHNEYKELLNIAEKIKPDLIHTNVGTLQAGYLVASKLNIPHIWHLREYQTKDFGWKILPSYDSFIQMLKQSYVITISKDIRTYFKLDNSIKVRQIYDGCGNMEDTIFEFPKKKYFLCCSRISPEKGQDKVIKAFSSFHKKFSDYKLVITGFGDRHYINYLKTQADKLKISDAVLFTGFQNDTKALMSNATAVIVASKFEGFGMMTAEAAFCGTIVIGHNRGGTKEILNIIGDLPYETNDELVKRMVEIATISKTEYKRMALYAQKAAILHFTKKKNVEQVYSFYTDIMKS